MILALHEYSDIFASFWMFFIELESVLFDSLLKYVSFEKCINLSWVLAVLKMKVVLYCIRNGNCCKFNNVCKELKVKKWTKSF